MRVLVVGERFPDSFADNVAGSAEDLGHEVTVVAPFRAPLDLPNRLSARLRSELPTMPWFALKAQRHVLDAADELEPHLVLNLDFRLALSTARELARRDGALAFWFPDSMGNLGRETHVLGGYDGIFLKDSTVVQRYRDILGLNAHFMAEACNPRWHRPPDGVAPGDDGPAILVAGNMYATRFALLQRLMGAGVDVRLYGPPWPRWLPSDERLQKAFTGVYLAREQKARSFRAAGLVLNAMASHEGDGANCRLFEAAGCGAVVLTEWRGLLPSLFEVPDEVLAFRTFDELLEQIATVGAQTDAEREALGDSASARAHAEHSYARRIEAIIQELGRG